MNTAELIQWIQGNVGFLLAVPLLPLAAYGIQILFGDRLPRRGDWLPTSAMFAAFLIALTFFVQTMDVFDPNFLFDSTRHGMSWSFFGEGWSSENLLGVGILYDNLTAIMLTMVTLVSFLIHLFSVGYMHGDRRYNVFFANLGLFSFAMLALLLSDNFLFFFVFWEIMGFCSYSLIGHFYDKPSAANACKKAFLTTRLGDVMLMLGVTILWWRFDTFQFTELYLRVGEHTAAHGWDGWLITAGLMVFGGAVGKSAQFPLHVWLPDAMEGPTPVSAMIHAATMVSAGVYLTGRAFLLFSPEVQLVVALIGSFTAIFAATIGIAQTDIKKVLAYSTISQLGYMIAAIGCGGWVWGLFHMLTHAIFKACLFLGSGSVIHAVHTQEMPEMGGLRKKMPITYLTMLSSTLAIAGIPLFAGFYSKDGIIMTALAKASYEGSFLYALPAVFLIAAAAMTAFYMFRLIFLTFHGEPRDHHKYDHAHESGPSMTIPLIVLGLGALLVGNFWPAKIATGHFDEVLEGDAAWFKKLFPEKPDAAYYATALGTETLQSSGGGLVPAAEGHGDRWHDALHAAHKPAMIISILAALSGILLAWLFYVKKTFSAERVAARLGGVHRAVLNKYYFDELYAAYVVRPTLALCHAMRWIDVWIVDGIVNGVGAAARVVADLSGIFDKLVVDGLVNAVAAVTQICGALSRVVQVGRVQTYVAYAAAGIVALAAIFLLL